jgi:hypothetical protein
VFLEGWIFEKAEKEDTFPLEKEYKDVPTFRKLCIQKIQLLMSAK